MRFFVEKKTPYTFHRKKIVLVWALFGSLLLFLAGRLGKLMLADSEYYSQKAKEHAASKGQGEEFWMQRA